MIIFVQPCTTCKAVVLFGDSCTEDKPIFFYFCSPSLFHRPSTPQMSSTHFEWNIDEMSSLNPTSFEAHETQFTSTTDPDVEAKAQAAISSFFREQVIGK